MPDPSSFATPLAQAQALQTATPPRADYRAVPSPWHGRLPPHRQPPPTPVFYNPIWLPRPAAPVRDTVPGTVAVRGPGYINGVLRR